MTTDLEPTPSDPAVEVVFALHFLGGTAAEWSAVVAHGGAAPRWIALDLPGFGDAAGATGFDVAAMAEAIAGVIRREAPASWALVGHSMGAKVACAVARRAEDGEAGLAGLARLVLVGGSPPAPEPMEDAKRAEMLALFEGSASAQRAAADRYIRANASDPLPPDVHAQAVEGVLRANPRAWAAWLTSGSREDWSARIGTLRTPTLILVGEGDDGLGLDAQARLTAPHLARARVHVVAGASHLVPMEQPAALAAAVARFLGPLAPGEPAVDLPYLALIASDRVSPRTRTVLLARLETPDPAPEGLPADAMRTLRALVDRIVPQEGTDRLDLAARMVAAVTAGPGDGWRFAALPPDATALRTGLATLDRAARARTGHGFTALGGPGQDALLAEIADGRSPAAGDDGFTSPQMAAWFEEMRAAAVQAYVAHPATQARIGFSGIANRGVAGGPQGFVAVGVGDREAWEPQALEERRP